LPGLHLVHAELPADEEYLPARQDRQLSSRSLPCIGEYVPAAQAKQFVFDVDAVIVE